MIDRGSLAGPLIIRLERVAGDRDGGLAINVGTLRGSDGWSSRNPVRENWRGTRG